jgi:hypothetical protein
MIQLQYTDLTQAVTVKPWMWTTDTLFPIPLDAFGEPIEGFQKPLGVAMIYPHKDMVVRAWLLCGRDYSVHPLDCINGDGKVVPLPTTRGLMPSEAQEFDWQIDTKRRLLLVAQAENELIRWADAYL